MHSNRDAKRIARRRESLAAAYRAWSRPGCTRRVQASTEESLDARHGTGGLDPNCSPASHLRSRTIIQVFSLLGIIPP